METKNIQAKLINIQQALVAPKDQVNNFGKYKYSTCEGILEAVKPLLNRYKLTVVMSDEMVNLGDRYYIKATVTLNDTESGESLSVTAFAREEEEKKGMDQSQVTGASSSYARKYALCGLFAIDGNKDSDETCEKTTDKPKPQQQEPQQIRPNTQTQTAQQQKTVDMARRKEKVTAYLNSLDFAELQNTLDHFNIEDVARITDQQVNAVADYLNAQRRQKQ